MEKYAKNEFFFCFNPYKNAKNHKKNIVDIISDVKLLAENDPGDKKKLEKLFSSFPQAFNEKT